MSTRRRNGKGRVADPALGSPRAKTLKDGGMACKNEGPGGLLQRLVDAGPRLHALHDSEALHQSVVDEAVHFSGAQRVLLVLIGPDGLRLAGSLLPQGEDARTLLHAVTPWLAEVGGTRTVSLRYGPEGANPIDQRSCAKSTSAPLSSR
jgi:hypothetical protein